MLTPGFNMVNPCSEEVRLVDMRIKLLPTGSDSFITKDNVNVIVKTSVAFRIINPIKSHYLLGHEQDHALRELTKASMRNAVG